MLPRGERLRSGRDFQRVYAQGKVYHDGAISLHVLHLVDRESERLVGFSVSKKVGNAVVRNRVRRRLREVLKSHRVELATGVILVISARPSAARVSFHTLEDSVARVLGRAGLLVSTTSSERANLVPGDSCG